MSLINQMLRDLDRRRATDGGAGGSDLLDGVRPPPTAGRGGSRRGLIVLLALLLLGLLALGAWYGLGGRLPGGKATPSATPPAAALPRLEAVALEQSPGRVRLWFRAGEARPAATLQATGGELLLQAAQPTPPLPRAAAPFADLRIEAADGGLRLRWTPAPGWQYRLLARGEHDWLLEATRPLAVAPVPAKPAPAPGPGPQPAARPAPAKAPPPTRKQSPAVAPQSQASVDAGTPRIAVRPRPLGPRERAIRARQAAREALARGRPRAAERHWREAIALAPGDAEGWQGLAEQLVREGRRAEALSLLREGLRRSGAPGLRLLAARLLVEADRLDEALSLLPDDALEGQADLLALKGAILQRLGRAEAARQAYVAALALRPQRPAWWMGLGLSLEGEGQPQRALEAYRRALAIPGLDQASRDFVQRRIQLLEKGQ